MTQSFDLSSFKLLAIELFCDRSITDYWCLVDTLVVAFAFLPKNFGKVAGTYELYLSVSECSLSS